MVLKMLMITKTFKFELSAIHLVLTLETWELQYWGDHKFCIHGFRERPRPGNTYQESNCVKDLRLWEVIVWSFESEVKNCSKDSLQDFGDVKSERHLDRGSAYGSVKLAQKGDYIEGSKTAEYEPPMLFEIEVPDIEYVVAVFGVFPSEFSLVLECPYSFIFLPFRMGMILFATACWKHGTLFYRSTQLWDFLES